MVTNEQSAKMMFIRIVKASSLDQVSHLIKKWQMNLQRYFDNINRKTTNLPIVSEKAYVLDTIQKA